ncbi:M56 family metallopeptidase [Abyssisolibacter fermentans]|uniref:M56 family metallopeptidase n=1 Tax=Abyssisolibacter fermentans TaxID=1766203 RepID=UPI00082D653A|nr:M56 family metallopeptidase [Abyssisolibacter fermentans]
MGYNSILNWLLDTSIKASVIIIVIISFKFILKDRIGANLNYNIWFLLLAKLIIPFAPKTSFSIYNLLHILYSNISAIGDIVQNNSHNTVELINSNITELDINRFGFNFNEINSINLTNLCFKLVCIWGLVAIGIVLFAIVNDVIFRKNLNKCSILKDRNIIATYNACLEKMHINRDIPIIMTDMISTPAIYGVIRPKILLPLNITELLDENELKYVFLHELSHYKRKDVVVFCLVTICKALNWFNPIVWFGLNSMKFDCEIACDALVLSYIKNDELIEYGNTILNLLKKVNNKVVKPLGVVGMLGYKSNLKRRIIMITKFKKRTFKIVTISIVTVCLMGGMLLTNAKGETNFSISQLKGENVKNEMLWPIPNKYIVINDYGLKTHPEIKKQKFHTGIDINAKKGDLIVAVKSGRVQYSGELDSYGQAIIVAHDNGLSTLYAHCEELLVKEGQNIKAGEGIAKVGSTGSATAPHLHFEVRQNGKHVNPLLEEYLGNILEKNNGN